MEPTKTSQTGTQTVDDATRQAQAATRQQPQVIIANPQVQYVTAQPINNGYTIQGIVVPYDNRQVMFNDDVLVDIIPAQKTQVIIANQPQPLNTVCTSGVPQLFYCTTDKKTLVSQVKYKTDKGMLCCWICLFILLFPFSLFFIFCWPLGYREAIHTCPECHREVGRVPTLF